MASQPPTGLDMRGLVLMGMPACGACTNSATWLRDHGVTFRKYDVSTSPAVINWLMQETGQRTVPQFFFNGQHVGGGFAQVKQLVQQGMIVSQRR